MQQLKALVAYLLSWLQPTTPGGVVALPQPLPSEADLAHAQEQRRRALLDPDHPANVRRGSKTKKSTLPETPPDSGPAPAWVGVPLGQLQARPALAPFVAPRLLSDVKLAEVAAPVAYASWGGQGEATAYEGMPLVVEVDQEVGVPGLPWSSGRLRLETHPDLCPVRARGYYGNPGVYHELQAVPPAANRLLEITTTVASSPWRLEDPKLPVGQDEALYREQVAFQRGLWARWSAPGQTRSLRAWIEELVRVPLTYGNGLWEAFMLPDGSPALPAFRAPWTVDRWVMQGETPLGWVQQTNTSDSWGRSAQRVLIPWERTIHVAHRPLGPSDLEGRSLLRDAYTPLRALIDLYGQQSLSAALNAVGTWATDIDKDAQVSDAVLDGIAEHIESYDHSHVPYIMTPPGVKMILHRPTDAVADLTPQIVMYERQAAIAMGGGHAYIALQGDGSRAARDSASGDARDLFDYYATMVCSGIERALRVYLQMRWPSGPHHVCTAAYGQVEQRDNASYIQTVGAYLEKVRPLLGAAGRQMFDALLDLPAEAQTPAGPSVTLAEDDMVQVPKGAAESALQGLAWVNKGLGGDGLTRVGLARANQLAKGGKVSRKVVKRMARFFSRFAPYKAKTGWTQGQEGFPIPARVAWELWGGDEGETWAAGLVERWEQEEEDAEV